MKNNNSIVIRFKNEKICIGNRMQVFDYAPKNEVIIVDSNFNDKSLEIANNYNTNHDLSSLY